MFNLRRSVQRLISSSARHSIVETSSLHSSPSALSWSPSDTSISHAAQQAIAKYKANQQTTNLSRFVNFTMLNGHKRLVMEQHVREGMLLLHRKTNQDPEQLFNRAMDMVSPVLECATYSRKSKRLRVPLPVTEFRGRSYAYRWLRDSLRKKRRPSVPFPERFANEILSILEGKSSLMQKRAALHKEALMNRGFSQFRWAVGYKP